MPRTFGSIGILLLCFIAASCSAPSFLPDHGVAATRANQFVVDLFVKGDVDEAARNSDVYWAALASSEYDYLAAARNQSIQSLGGSPDSLLLVSHFDHPRTGTIVHYYLATGPNGTSVSYLVQVTAERRGLLIRTAFVGEKIPTPHDTSDIPADALRQLVAK